MVTWATWVLLFLLDLVDLLAFQEPGGQCPHLVLGGSLTRLCVWCTTKSVPLVQWLKVGLDNGFASGTWERHFFCFLTQVCRPDSQCKTGVPGADGVSVLQCAIHNRTRAANYLDLGTGFVSHVFWETSLCGTRWPLPMQTWSRVQGEWEGCLSLDSFSVQFHQLCVHCIKGCITRLTRRKLPLAASPGRPNALFCTLFLLLLCLLS